MVDLFLRLFKHAPLCFLFRVTSLRKVSLHTAGAWYLIDDVQLFFSWKGVFCISEQVTEGRSGPEHRFDVEVSTQLPYHLIHACYIWKKGYWRFLCVRHRR